MIRGAVLSDVEGILDIWNTVIRESTITFTTVQKTKAELDAWIKDRPVFVIDQDGQIMGFASYGPFRVGPGYRFVAEHSIYLSEAAQGRGLGAELLSVIEHSAVKSGIDVLIAGCDGGNAQAQRFHEKQGFTHVALLPGVGEKFGARHDLVLMQKKL